jgi:hypothetical protein
MDRFGAQSTLHNQRFHVIAGWVLSALWGGRYNRDSEDANRELAEGFNRPGLSRIDCKAVWGVGFAINQYVICGKEPELFERDASATRLSFGLDYPHFRFVIWDLSGLPLFSS